MDDTRERINNKMDEINKEDIRSFRLAIVSNIIALCGFILTGTSVYVYEQKIFVDYVTFELAVILGFISGIAILTPFFCISRIEHNDSKIAESNAKDTPEEELSALEDDSRHGSGL